MRLVLVILCTTSQVLCNEVKQDEAQDRFVDLSVDVSYGLPQLGYVYNGLHLRGPRSSRDYRKARQGFSHYVHHDDHGSSFQAHHDHSEIKPELDFDSEFESLRSKIKRNPVPVPDVKVVVDSEGPYSDALQDDQNIEVLVEESYKNPSESFVVPREVESTTAYEAPEINYAEPEEEITYEVSESYNPPVTYSPHAYSDQFSKPPYVAPSNTDAKYYPPSHPISSDSSKPPLPIKIKQDLQGLFGSVTNPFKKSKPSKPIEVVNADVRPKRQSGLKLKLPQTPPGKPPLMEKIRQDFFSWLPSKKSPSSSSKSQFEGVQSVDERPKRQSFSPIPKEPLLGKFVKDIGKMNRWIANQAIDVSQTNNPIAGFSSAFRTSVDDILFPAKKRQDHKYAGVQQYIPQTQ